MKLFVSGTGTGVGKTWLTSGLARRLDDRGRSVAALKPLETGCDPDALDALALAAACRRPDLASYPGFYRARLPLAPAAASLAGEPPPPNLALLVQTILAASAGADDLIVEGAGGVLVPLDDEHDLVDLALALELPLLLVATDALGTLSHTRAAVEAARTRGARIQAIALTQHAPTPDLSSRSNAQLLAARTGLPVLRFAHRPEGPSAEELDALIVHLDR